MRDAASQSSSLSTDVSRWGTIKIGEKVGTSDARAEFGFGYHYWKHIIVLIIDSTPATCWRHLGGLEWDLGPYSRTYCIRANIVYLQYNGQGILERKPHQMSTFTHPIIQAFKHLTYEILCHIHSLIDSTTKNVLSLITIHIKAIASSVVYCMYNTSSNTQ